MIRLRHKLFVYLLRVLDPVVLVSSLMISMSLLTADPAARSVSSIVVESLYGTDAIGIACLLGGWLLVYNLLVRYDTDRFTGLRSELKDVTAATSVAAFLLVVVSGVFAFGRVTNEVTILTWTLATLATMASRIAARILLRAVRRYGFNFRHVIVVGANRRGLTMASRLERQPELGYKVVGFVRESTAAGDGALVGGRYRVLGSLPELQQVLETGPVDELLVCLPMEDHVADIVQAVRLSREMGVVARLFPDESSAQVMSRMHVEQFHGQSVVTLFREQMLLQLLVKRSLDILVALAVLTLGSPVLLLAALAIRLTSPGPIFFVQGRVGMNKRVFGMFKFRSMYADAEGRRHELAHLNEMDGPVFKIANDPRVTPVGRFLRRTSIDELPQLLNVLRGEMSLVGPRPPLPEEVDKYEWLYRKRLSIKPGITCLWQVTGRNQVSFKEWMELDRQYIEQWSLWLDLKILLRTIPAVLSWRGAS